MPSTASAPTSSKTRKKNPRKIFSVGIIASLTSKNNADFLCKACEAMCELGFPVFVMAEGNQTSQEKCFELTKQYPNFHILESSATNKSEILEHASLLLFAEKPSKELLKTAIQNELPFVIPENSGFDNFNPQKESGEAFTFPIGNFWKFMTAIIRASENYNFSYDWKTLKKNLAAK